MVAYLLGFETKLASKGLKITVFLCNYNIKLKWYVLKSMTQSSITMYYRQIDPMTVKFLTTVGKVLTLHFVFHFCSTIIHSKIDILQQAVVIHYLNILIKLHKAYRKSAKTWTHLDKLFITGSFTSEGCHAPTKPLSVHHIYLFFAMF